MTTELLLRMVALAVFFLGGFAAGDWSGYRRGHKHGAMEFAVSLMLRKVKLRSPIKPQEEPGEELPDIPSDFSN